MSNTKNLINKEEQERRKIRTKIANTVRRNNINKKCFNCEKEGKIIYDFKNPYNVVFICTECKSNPDLVKEAENHRIDIKDMIKIVVNNSIGTNGITNKQIRWIDKENVIKIIDEFLKSPMTLEQYIAKLNLSRHQFYGIVERYNSYLPEDETINKEIKLKMNKVQRDNVIQQKHKNK